jgi:putative hydrolase of the HAD superfamily
MSVTKYQAIVFDLWGTLVDECIYPEANRLIYERKKAETADVLGVDLGNFSRAWSAGKDQRNIDAFSSTEDALSHICRELGVEPGEDRIRAAAEMRYEYVREALMPRPGALETISSLRESGYKVGLISNCTEEVARLWESTPFAPLMDATLLSFEVGLAKPDVGIYELAATQLGVAAGRCLFVGDGSGGELTGATKAGMAAVLMRAPSDQADGAREGWVGDRISALIDVLRLVD